MFMLFSFIFHFYQSLVIVPQYLVGDTSLSVNVCNLFKKPTVNKICLYCLYVYIPFCYVSGSHAFDSFSHYWCEIWFSLVYHSCKLVTFLSLIQGKKSLKYLHQWTRGNLDVGAEKCVSFNQNISNYLIHYSCNRGDRGLLTLFL